MKATNRRRQDGSLVPSLRCSNRKCQTFRSVRSGNPFFHWRDKNDNCRFRLSLCEILEIVFLWSHRTSSQQAIEAEEEEGCIGLEWWGNGAAGGSAPYPSCTLKEQHM